tara:strand:+ start:1262 stop:1390 length:129 start_codon:yes stop_codon:yes gene_type:complete
VSIKSNTNVSLTYLRALEIPELTEEDMPVIDKVSKDLPLFLN